MGRLRYWSMRYQEYRPAPPLSSHIRFLWYCEGYLPPHSVEKVLPNGCMQIVFNLDRNYICNLEWRAGQFVAIRRSPMLVAGLYTRGMLLDTGDMRRIVGILFRPGGGPAILGHPAHEYTNLDVDLEASGLRDQLLEADSVESVFVVMEAWLLRKLAMGLPSHPAVSHALRLWETKPEERSLEAAQRVTNLSGRRFREVFRAQTGVAPKVYLRMLRFREALRCASRGEEPRWAEIAQHCGYFDQAHLQHDFKAFSGFSPGECLSKRLYWTDHFAADSYNTGDLSSVMLDES